MKLLLLHGVNLNILGRRDPTHYGSLTLPQLVQQIKDRVESWGWELLDFQSNHEGDFIDFIQQESPQADAILINPGAWTHSSYALHDALLDAALPSVEVHLSDIQNRESWRAESVIKPACAAQFFGEGLQSYFKALDFLKARS